MNIILYSTTKKWKSTFKKKVVLKTFDSYLWGIFIIKYEKRIDIIRQKLSIHLNSYSSYEKNVLILLISEFLIPKLLSNYYKLTIKNILARKLLRLRNLFENHVLCWILLILY